MKNYIACLLKVSYIYLRSSEVLHHSYYLTPKYSTDDKLSYMLQHRVAITSKSIHRTCLNV